MADPTSSLFGIPMPGADLVAEAAAMSPQSAAPRKYVEKDPKHRGAAGVGRDILGTLGDFLLTRLKMPAMYAPAQQRRRLATAMEDIDTDPVGAIQQVTSIDPVRGAELREKEVDNKRADATLASAQVAREALAEDRAARIAMAQEAVRAKARGRAASMLNTLTQRDEKKRAALYPALRDQVLKAGNAAGVDLSGDLPKDYDAFTLDAFIDEAVPVGTQRAQRLTRERIEQTGELADKRDKTTRRGQDISSADRAAARTQKAAKDAEEAARKKKDDERKALDSEARRKKIAADLKKVKSGQLVMINGEEVRIK